MTGSKQTSQHPHFLRQVSQNALALGVGYVVSRILTIGMLMILARKLSIAEFGKFTLLITLIGLCEIIPVIGLDRLAIREIGRDPTKGWRDVPHLLGLVFVSSIFVAILLAVTVWSLGIADESLTLAWVTGITIVPIAMATLLDGALQGAQMMAWCARGMISLGVGSFLTAGAIALWGLGIQALFIGLLFTHVLRLGLLLYAIPIRAFPKFILSRWRSTLLEGAPYALSNALGVIQLKLDLVFVAWLQGEEGAAVYGVAFKFVELTIFVSVIGVTALLPTIVRLRENLQQLEKAYLLCLKIAGLAAFPIAFLVFQNTEILLSTLFADQYLIAQSTLQILAGVMFVLILQVPNLAVLLSAPQQRSTVIVSLVIITLNALLNILLIPSFGPAGAASAALCAITVGTGLSIHFVQKSLGGFRFDLLCWEMFPTVSGGVALLLLTYGSLLYFSQLFSLFIGLVGYFSVVLLVDSRASDYSLVTLCFARFKAPTSTNGVPTL